MPTFQVTDRAYQLQGSGSPPFQLKNAGSSPIYVGDRGTGSSVSATNKDHTIAPGGMLGLTGTEPTWVICDTGLTSEVELIYNGSGAYSPGPSDVLARISAQPELIATYTLNVPAAAGNYFSPGGGLYLGPVDISNYASIRFNLKFSGSGLVGLPGVNDLIALSVVQCKDATGVIGSATKVEGPNWWFQDDAAVLPAGLRSFATNVIDRYLISNITVSKPVTPNAAVLTVEVWGSFTQVARPYEYEGGILNAITVRMQDKQMSALIPAAGNTFFTHTAGTTYFALTCEADASDVMVGILLAGSVNPNHLVGRRKIPGASTSFQASPLQTFFAPARRLMFNTAQFVATPAGYLNLTQQ